MNQSKINRANISSIETFFDKILRGKTKLTENLFFNELPVNLDKNWKEFVVVDCGNPVRDSEAYSVGTVLVYLYVKQNAYGLKDVKTMQKLESAINTIIDESRDEHYHVSIRGRYANYNAVNDVYMNIVQINLIIT